MTIATVVMEKMLQAFATGKLSDMDSYVHPQYVDHQGLRGVAISGREGFRKVVEAARSSYAGLGVTIEDSLVDGQKVAARLRWTGKRTEDGVTFTRETVDILRVEDGKAIEHWGARLWLDPE